MRVLLPTSTDFLRLQATRQRHRGGLVFRNQAVPFAALVVDIEAACAWLAARGVGGGDHVVVLAGNHPGLVVWYYALWSLGAVVVPAGTRSSSDEVSHLLQHCEARLLLADEERRDLARTAAAAAGVAAAVAAATSPGRLSLLNRRRLVATRPRPPAAHHLAMLAYTSGTTGTPKGVMLDHANLWWSALACATARDDRPEGVALCLSPLTHTPVFVSHLLCRILTGQTAVLIEKFDVDTILEQVERHAVTDLPLIAGMVFSLIERGHIPAKVRRSVTKVSVGGAATPMPAKEKLAALFPQADVFEAYGQSESTDGVTMARGGTVFSKPGTIGRPNPFVAVDVLRTDGTLAEAGEEGELVISGPTVMRGYFRDAKATRAAMSGSWLRTGDLGRRDADGYLFITGRAKDLIITGGENVSPIEVESVLRRHPGVADVAVIGTPHPRWGEQVTAVVVPVAGRTLAIEDLLEFSGRHLSAFKKPRRVELVPALPRNAANKVQTALLKEQFAGKV